MLYSTSSDTRCRIFSGVSGCGHSVKQKTFISKPWSTEKQKTFISKLCLLVWPLDHDWGTWIQCLTRSIVTVSQCRWFSDDSSIKTAPRLARTKGETASSFASPFAPIESSIMMVAKVIIQVGPGSVGVAGTSIGLSLTTAACPDLTWRQARGSESIAGLQRLES